MADTHTQTVFTPLRQAAAALGVPVAWLRAEAAAGRVPHLRAGRRILLNVVEVAALLAERAAAGEGGPRDE